MVPRRNRSRRFAVGGALAVGLALAMASAAFACTVFLGRMTVWGDADTNGDGSGFDSRATVVGNATGMGYCSMSGYAYSYPAGSNDIYIRVEAYGGSTNCPASKLPATGSDPRGDGIKLDYDVTYVNYGFYNSSLYRDCMAVGGHTSTVKIGDITVDSNGLGGGYYGIPDGAPAQDGTPYEAGVCVSDTNYSPSLYGNQAPVVVL